MPSRALPLPTLRNDLLISVILATVLTGLSYLIGFQFKFIDSVSYVELIAVWASYSCTYLCVMERRINYPIGAVAVIALMILFYEQKLYSSALLQVYLFPTLAYGWWYWRRDDNKRPVRHVSRDLSLVVILTLTLAIWFICQFVTNYMGAEMAQLDSSILVLSILAQFWMDRKVLECWLIWILVDIISVYAYFQAGSFVVAIQMLLFLFNAIWGYYMWYNSMKVGQAI